MFAHGQLLQQVLNSSNKDCIQRDQWTLFGLKFWSFSSKNIQISIVMKKNYKH